MERVRNVTFVGNCQALALANLYRGFIGGAEFENVVYYNDHGKDPEVVRAAVRDADVVVAQERDFTHAFATAALRPGVKVHTFPTVLAGFMWPFANEAHVHNVPEPPFSDGPYPSQLSDSYLNRLIVKGVSPEDALEQYLALDVAKAANIDRMLELYVDRQRKRDAKTGFDIASIVESRFNTERLFASPNHPTALLFRIIAQQMFEQMSIPSNIMTLALDSLYRSPFPPDELPIHPRIIEHFGITYVDAVSRYSYFDEGSFTFNEYVLRYMRYENNQDLRSGMFMLHTGNLTEALELVEKGLDRSPQSNRGHRARGHLLTWLGRRGEAMGSFRRSVELAPADPENLTTLARFVMDEGDLTEATELTQRALELIPVYAPGHALLAEIANTGGAKPNAIAAISEAARLEPGNAHYQRIRSMILESAGDLLGAEEAARKALRMNPDSADLLNMLAGVLEGSGRRAEAIEVLESGIARGCQNPQTLSLLGHFRLRSGELAAAEEAFRRGFELDPHRTDMRDSVRELRQLGEDAARASRPPAAAAVPAGKIVFVGNCQAQALQGVFEHHIARHLDGVSTSWVDAWQPGRMDLWRREIGEADLIVVQHANSRAPVEIDAIRSGVRQLAFPDVRGHFLWPFGDEPRVGNPTPSYKPAGPYNPEVGDGFLNRLVRKGTAPEDALDRYMDLDVASAANLDRVFELILAQQRNKDAATGIAVADHIEQRFREERLFITPGHLGTGLFRLLASQLYAAMGVSSSVIEEALGQLLAPPFEQYHEAPLHPATIRHFGLRFVDDATEYHHVQEGKFNFAERVLRYMRCEWSPELHAGRARVGDEDPREALRLLERGLERAPHSAYGYRWKAFLLRRLGRFDDAVQDLIRATELEPADLDYAHDLAKAREGR